MNNSIEIWKDIEGYEGLYPVSNMGRIRSLDRIKPNSGGQIAKGKIKSIVDNGNGYKIVNLYKGGTSRMKYVHRLVAEAFLANTHNYPQINHKDENKNNNKLTNLEWCSSEYNCNYGNHAQKARLSHIVENRNREIDMYDFCGNLIKTFLCSNDVCKEIGIERRQLYQICKGVAKSWHGYRFAFHGEKLKEFSTRKRGYKIRVIQYNEESGKIVSRFDSMREAERTNSLYRGFLRINNIKNNGCISHNGYRYILI